MAEFILTPEHKQMLKGQVCPYCKKPSKFFQSSAHIYGKDYGPVWTCMDCQAWCGCHPGTNKPLGRLANKELRLLKKELHDQWFDKLWKWKIMSRHEAYEWLSRVSELPKQYTHIGMMGPETIKKVIIEIKRLFNDLRRLDLDFGAKPMTPYYDI